MRIFRYRDVGGVKPGVFGRDGLRRDASALTDDYHLRFFESDGLARLAKAVASDAPELTLLAGDPEYAAPVPRPGKIICIGLNYADHARESGAAVPAEPVVFMKAPHTMVGPNDPIIIPRKSVKTDWEVELGVLIGRGAEYLASPAEAAGVIAGYCISHDVSEREFQLEHCGQWTKGKSCRNFNPLGPWIVTADEIPDLANLSLKLYVNDRLMQAGNTSNMVFNPHFLVHYLSQFMPLEPGDVISTGTPSGVGMGRKPQVFLKPGDVTRLEITGLGAQRQACRAAE